MDEAWDRSGQRSLWYRLGYTLERAKGRTGAAGALLGAPPGGEPWEHALSASLRLLAKGALGPLGRRARPRRLRLLGAGAAGASLALAEEALGALLAGKPREEALATLALGAALAGAQRGLLYGSLVEPLIPAPPLLRGAAFGLIEHLAASWGGLSSLAADRAPGRATALLGRLLDDAPPRDDPLWERLAFGIALAALLGDDAR